ncbi:nitroreductase family protein [Streptomyces sp. NPDC060198]|uniref:nitroreductase family protein n=1 Tax=Streptomyces sp. NPDC060198 TaxID=3347070 RepID=UPI00364D0E3A
MSPETRLDNRVTTSAGLAAALRAVEGSVAVGGGGERAVPSAGAIYPYEFYVVLAGHGTRTGQVLAVDPVRRRCRRVGAGEASVRDQCLLAGIDPPEPGGALLVLVTRPWLSMRKYADRGYLYTQLDAAHMAVNALGTSQGRGTELLLRFDRRPMEVLLGLVDRCREIHSLLRVGTTGDAALPDGWSVHAEGPATEGPSWMEQVCWESLLPVLPGDEAPKPVPGARPLTRPGPSARPVPELSAPRWTALSRRRRSSKRYVPSAVPADVLDLTLAAAATALRTDLPPSGELGVTVLARTVEGAPSRVFRLSGEPAPPLAKAPDGDLVVRACMGQEHLRHAAAFVVFHAPRADLVTRRSACLRELLFRAGGTAHLLYLGATAAGLGVTAVGGFDAALWRTASGLPEDHDPVYLLSLGATGRGGVKWDRMPVAYAQSEG